MDENKIAEKEEEEGKEKSFSMMTRKEGEEGL